MSLTPQKHSKSPSQPSSKPTSAGISRSLATSPKPGPKSLTRSAASLKQSSAKSNTNLPPSTRTTTPGSAKKKRAGTAATTTKSTPNVAGGAGASVVSKLPIVKPKPVVDVTKPLSKSEEVLMDACKEGNVDLVYKCVWEKVNLNCRLPYYGTTPLSMAFKHNHKIVCNVLINFGAKFDPDNYGVTPVHWAAHQGHSRLIRDQVHSGHISRTDLQKRDFFGSTPLHFASVNNLSDCVQTLLDVGCDSLVANNDGRLASQLTDDLGIKNILLEAQKFDAEMHKRLEEEERLAAKKSREGASRDRKKKGKSKTGTATANSKGKPGTSGKSVVVGAKKIMVPGTGAAGKTKKAAAAAPPPLKGQEPVGVAAGKDAKAATHLRTTNAWTTHD
ncbi:hypothetical protein HDU98_000898 [Podochytrium sp. JEL0797]|nr:hypothetical protein HDU98_000898 [Podochytrium sp. JEL0797]